MYCEKYLLINSSSINIFCTINTLLILEALELDNTVPQYVFAPLPGTEI